MSQHVASTHSVHLSSSTVLLSSVKRRLIEVPRQSCAGFAQDVSTESATSATAARATNAQTAFNPPFMSERSSEPERSEADRRLHARLGDDDVLLLRIRHADDPGGEEGDGQTSADAGDDEPRVADGHVVRVRLRTEALAAFLREVVVRA